MPGSRRATIARFAVTAISLLVAFATGASWIGQPFRAVELLTLIGLGAMAGVSWMQAIHGVRERSPRTPSESER